jgi:hypothetical protein
MKVRRRKAIIAVIFSFLFGVAVLATPGHEDAGGGNDPPCRRGSNPSPKRPCRGQPHPEDPQDCDCGIGNDGTPPPAHEKP